MVFHWSLSDSKSLQVSRTLLSILADLSYAVIIIIISWEFFTQGLADGLPLEFKWQQFSLGLLDSSPQSYGLDSLRSSFDFQHLQCQYQSFENSPKCTNYIFSFFWLDLSTCLFGWDGKVYYSAISPSFVVDYHYVWYSILD